MTLNQIRFMELMEGKRHNLSMESETQRTNIANERLKSEVNSINATHYERQDIETARANRAREKLEASALAETNRHNLRTESTALQQISVQRENLQLGWQQFSEARRHNIASEETARYGVEYNYELGARNAKVAERNAATNEYNAASQRYQTLTNAELGRRNTAVNEANVSINQLNAWTARRNAETNAINAETQRLATEYNAYYREKELEQQRWKDAAQIDLGYWQSNNDYNLRWESNRIAAINSDINQQRASTYENASFWGAINSAFRLIM